MSTVKQSAKGCYYLAENDDIRIQSLANFEGEAKDTYGNKWIVFHCAEDIAERFKTKAQAITYAETLL